MKNLLGNLILLSISLAIVFLIGEVTSRYVTPISPGPSILDMDGNKQKISYIEAGKQFRITTSDFDAITTITKDGYRAPEAKGKPDIIFMGDSFTYAQGVADNETFPAIYCKARGLNCANLGVPGSSTLYEVDRLEHFIKAKGWSPKMVHFFFFTGNDFGDNIEAAARRKQGLPYEPVELNQRPSDAEEKGFIKSAINTGLKHSNLLRVAYFKILPMIRDNPDESKDTLNQALDITKAEFTRLDKLSKDYAFNYKIYIIHPEPEITHNVYQEIDTKLQALTKKPLIALGDLFRKDTKDYFFPSDGHFSVAGNKKLADFLLKN
jgi:lysophospholipase L1-like esterase